MPSHTASCSVSSALSSPIASNPPGALEPLTSRAWTAPPWRGTGGFCTVLNPAHQERWGAARGPAPRWQKHRKERGRWCCPSPRCIRPCVSAIIRASALKAAGTFLAAARLWRTGRPRWARPLKSRTERKRRIAGQGTLTIAFDQSRSLACACHVRGSGTMPTTKDFKLEVVLSRRASLPAVAPLPFQVLLKRRPYSYRARMRMWWR